MQTTNSVLSLIDELSNIRKSFSDEIKLLGDYASKIILLENENKTLRNKCDKFEKLSVEHKEEADSLRRVSIIKNMSKQVHDLKSQNEILVRKINHYKSIADIKTENSLLSASNFDGKESIGDNNDSIEIEIESNPEDYKITESLARLLNIPIETKITSKDAVSKVLKYIEDNNIYDSKNYKLKNDYKLYAFLNIDEELDKDESAEVFKNLCKLVKKYGLITGDTKSDSIIKSENKVKTTIEDYVSSSSNGKSTSYITGVLSAANSEPYATIDTASEEDEEDEELEVKKIGKKYYYVSIDTSIVYKAVRLKSGEYDVGKRLGKYDGIKIIKD